VLSKGKLRLAAVVAVAAALLVAARFLPLREWVGQLQAGIAGLGLAGMLLFAVVYLAGTLLLAPVWVLAVVAGLTYPFWTAFALVSAVSTFAAAAAFMIARRFARARVEELVRRDPRLQAVDRAVAHGGWKVVFLLRLSPLVPYAVSNYLYGVTAIPFGAFVLASWVGMMPGTLLYLSFGAAGRAAAGPAGRTPVEWAALGVGIAATLAVTAWIGRAARRELARDRLADAAGVRPAEASS
jgi:uncharacterized membrane protein YdjX (TVP38/TMEM64 family)